MPEDRAMADLTREIRATAAWLLDQDWSRPRGGPSAATPSHRAWILVRRPINLGHAGTSGSSGLPVAIMRRYAGPGRESRLPSRRGRVAARADAADGPPACRP